MWPKMKTVEANVKPNSNRNSIKLVDGVYEIRVTVPPEKGRATKKALELLADELGVSKSQIELKTGAKSRHKVFSIL